MDVIFLKLPTELLYKIILNVQGARKLIRSDKEFQTALSDVIHSFTDSFYVLVPDWKKHPKKLIDKIMKERKKDLLTFLLNNYIVNKFYLVKSASKYGNLKLLKYAESILNKTVSINKITKWAIEGDNKEIILYGINNGATIYRDIAVWATSRNLMNIINDIPGNEMSESIYKSILYEAIKVNNMKFYDFALKHITNINYDKIALLSSKYGRFDIFLAAFQHEITDYEEIMFSALKNNHIDIVKFLLERNIRPYRALLSGSVASNNLDTINYLVSNGYINIESIINYTLDTERIELFKKLIDIYNNDIQKKLLLVRATILNKVEVLKYLAKTKKDFNIISKNVDNLDVARFVLNKYPEFANNVAFNAAKYNKYNTLKFAIIKGATNINSIAISAIKRDNDKLLEIALENGANNINELLHAAINYKRLNLGLYLIEKYGASNKIINKLGEIAAEEGNLLVIKKLMDYGLNNLNEIGIIAAKENFSKIVFYVLKNGATNINEVFEEAMKSGNVMLATKISRMM